MNELYKFVNQFVDKISRDQENITSRSGSSIIFMTQESKDNMSAF